MRNPFNRLAITALILILVSDRLQAQTPRQPSSTRAYRVEGLTSDDRDRIARQFAIEGDFRIVFACMPAGIVVIEAVREDKGEAAFLAATTRLRAGVPGRSPVPDDRSMAELEEACSDARNQ